jgi:hypothetical protein
MNMVDVEDIEDIVFGPMPAAEPTPAPAVAAEGGSTDSGATAARAESTPAAPASRAEEVEGTKDIEDIRNINTVECIKDVECSGAAAVADVPRLPPPAEPRARAQWALASTTSKPQRPPAGERSTSGAPRPAD